MRISNTALFAIASGIWGSTWLAITYQLGTVPPQVSVAYRFALAALILAAYCIASRRSLRFPRRAHPMLAAFGATLFGLNYIGVYLAERYVASGLVAVVFSTIVFMSPIGMRIVYREPLTVRTLVAATLGVTGVALLFLPELRAARHGGSPAVGIAFAFGATAIATIGNMIAVRNYKIGLPTFPATTWGMAYGAVTAAIVVAILGLPWTFEWTPAYTLSLVYLAVFGSVIAFGAYLTLLKRVGAAPTSFVGVATPVIALLLSTFFEGYRWTWVGVAGIALAVAGNWLMLRRKPA